MPDLPTLTVTQAQADRMLAAYGSAANYRAWLREQIIHYVKNYEIASEDQTYQEQRQSKMEEIETDLTA